MQLCLQSPSPSIRVTSISVPIGCSSSSKLESGFTGNIYGFSQFRFQVICLRFQFLEFFLSNQKKGDYHVIISSKLSKMICFWKWISLWFLSGPLLGHILLTKSFYNPFGRATTVKVPLINHLIHLVTIQNSLVTKNIKILLGSPYFLAHELGSRRWNWKFRERHFWNPNPELLLHSSYSFLHELSTTGSCWDLASQLPWKNCEKHFLYFS